MSESPYPANSVQGSHCSSCGAPYEGHVSGWPRTCAACGAVAYRNPLPVAVALQPVYDRQGTGLVVVTRTIAPALGGVALPGGFVDDREDWRDAVVRELKEETGICAQSRDARLADAMSAPDGYLLLFGLLPERPVADLPAGTPTDETEGWDVLRHPDELAFPLHTLAARAFFEGRYI
ncbi:MULTISPECIES: NUDIX domain-containing protein [unclassified Streptomyces]|uniref:NUDIX domain-containing protein n=1 Tax=Streptomyces sp. A1499 TaxID=2563104 RepID=UPI0007470B21|nr:MULTISPECIES: NUDIX domain-containing protein [unclassified Streptomyces]KUL51950.1 NUDIX hydrolase [Streptomyces sp. NRRL S-1521]THC50989.1 NUDIX domain-containing protein [Streptomyces sp. A1499]